MQRSHSIIYGTENPLIKTAALWTRLYASESVNGQKSSVEESDLYRIDHDLIEEFESQGFDKAKIVEVLRRLGIKSLDPNDNNTANRIIEELLK